jgi:hypothetical protein
MMLALFLDQEVGPDEHAQISEHLEQCRACRKALQDHQSVSAIFKERVSEESSGVILESLEEQVLTVVTMEDVSWWIKLREFLLSKKSLIPAAAATAALALFVYMMKPPAPVPGPSAIINSCAGEITSVMIMETPKSRQTILWFHEASIQDEDENGLQEAFQFFPYGDYDWDEFLSRLGQA